LPAGTRGTIVSALPLAGENGVVAKYAVQHYPRPACGRAFGPLALDQTLRFCRQLAARLAEPSCDYQGPLFLTTPPADSESHTNALVLLGAYLVFDLGWSATHISDVLGGKETRRKFACSWTKKANLDAQMFMPVQFCWEGFELAHQCGWLDTACLSDDVSTDLACKQYDRMVATYDASWIIPGELLVSADPVTTVHDPNPETFTHIFPAEDAGEEDDDCGSEGTPDPPSISPIKSPSNSVSDSVATVCKTYPDYLTKSKAKHDVQNKSFIAFLQDCDVALMVRANMMIEPGMPAQSYEGTALAGHGIKHEDIPFGDRHGALPGRSDVARLLKVSRAVAEDHRAMLVHCKGGFGRSAVLACCAAIDRYDVPGRALLGWVRIARPGSINTPEQEQFLCSMKGAADVSRFAGLQAPMSSQSCNNGASEMVGCRPGCSVM